MGFNKWTKDVNGKEVDLTPEEIVQAEKYFAETFPDFGKDKPTPEINDETLSYDEFCDKIKFNKLSSQGYIIDGNNYATVDESLKHPWYYSVRLKSDSYLIHFYGWIREMEINFNNKDCIYFGWNNDQCMSARMTEWGAKYSKEISEIFNLRFDKEFPMKLDYYRLFYDSNSFEPFPQEHYEKYFHSKKAFNSFFYNQQFDKKENGTYDGFFRFVVNGDMANRFRECENILREQKKVPKIGEGWVSETTLYYFLKGVFEEEDVIAHGKPKWLGRQHLDVYFPEHNIGIEYQGKQHSEPVAFFGGEEAFLKNKERDKRKKQLCEENGCHLIEVFPDYRENKLVKKIEKLIENKR